MQNSEATKQFAGFEFPVLDFSGGLNTKSSQYLLGRDTIYSLRPNELVVLENVDRGESGAVSTRPGYSKLNSTVISPAGGDNTIRSIYEYRKSTGTDLIIVNAGNSLYKYNGTNFDLIGTVTTANTKFSWTVMNDLLIGCNGVDIPIKYDGTTLANLGGSPPTGPSITTYYREHIMFAKGLTIYFSAVGDPEDYTTVNNAGSLPVPAIKGTHITGLLAFYDRLIIFTDHEVIALTGTVSADFAFQPITYEYGNRGCHKAVVPAGNNDVLFCSNRGVHRLAVTDAAGELGNLEETYASAKIEPTWQNLNAVNLTSRNAINNESESQIIFLVGFDGEDNDGALVADYYHRDRNGNPTWVKYTNYPFFTGYDVHSLNEGEHNVLLGGYDGFVYLRGGNLDVDQQIPIKLSYVTDANLPEWEKLFRWINLFVVNIDAAVSIQEPFTINASFDFGQRSISNTLSISLVGGKRLGIDWVLGTDSFFVSSLSTPKVSIPGVGRYVSLLFTFTSASRLTFNGFILYGARRRLII